MNLRTSLAAAGAAAILATTGALALPAVASAHSASTTLKFISVTKGSTMFTKMRAASKIPMSMRRARPSGSTCSISRPPRQPPVM